MKHLSKKVAYRLFHLQLLLQPLVLSAQFDSLPNFRYYDKRGINVFEALKQPVKDYNGIKIRFGAGLAQSFQALSHSNSADGKGDKDLYAISPGFNTAMANFTMDVQLAAGIRLNLVSHLSSRYRSETRLKAGYLQIDKLPVEGEFWERLMKVMTIKAGHMEINYGDAHFRRSDGGHTIYNPFMDNYILDAYTMETAAEVYARKKCFFAMAGISNGMIKGNTDSMAAGVYNGKVHKSPSIYFKAGIDKSVADWLRLRVSGSYYHNGSSANNALFNGDRAGSNYFMVMEKAGAGVTSATNAFSGKIDPVFTNRVDAFQFNAFFKLIALELFATYETAAGRNAEEENSRNVNQVAVDWIFRFGDNENIFIGGRYNQVTIRLPGFTENVKVDRATMALGYFFTRNILFKCEIVEQLYTDFPGEDYRNSGKFKGFMIQAVIAF